jgi:hypothetical protein
LGEQKPVTASLLKDKNGFGCAFNLALQCVISNFSVLSFMSLNGIGIRSRTKTNNVT